MKLIRVGSAVALAGYILSGPVGFVLVKLLHPQPAWISAEVFAKNYSVVQDVPFILGFLLLGGMVIVAAGHYTVMEHKASGLLGLLATAVFASLICFNYVCQTTFVRNMTIHYRPEFDVVITAFSMANPLSLAWSIEMWGYAFLGMATWLWAGYYSGRNDTMRWLLIANGLISMATALLAVINLEWIMSTAGLVGYMTWNILMIVLMTLMYKESSAHYVTEPIKSKFLVQ